MSLDVREPGRFSLPITILVFFGIIAALLASFGASLAALVIALVVIPIAVRMAMIRVWLAGDLLRVRNFWRSFDLAGPEVAHFAVKDAVESRALRRRMVWLNAWCEVGA